MSSQVTYRHILRRDLLERKGFEFQDRDSPHVIVLNFDIPNEVAMSGFQDISVFLLNRIHRARRRGHISNPSTGPDDKTVRLVLFYELWDLFCAFDDEMIYDLALERIAHLLRARITWEKILRASIPWWPEPEELESLTIYQYDLWGGVRIV